MTHDKYGGKGLKKNEKDKHRKEFMDQVINYHGIRHKDLFTSDIQSYILKEMGKKNGHKKLLKGAMTWAIAKSYYELFAQKNSKHVNILKKMLNHDPAKRLSLEQSIKEVETILKMKNTMPHEVTIDITKHKYKKKIYKIFGITKKQAKKLNFLRNIFTIEKKQQRGIKSSREHSIAKNKKLTKSQKITILNRSL